MVTMKPVVSVYALLNIGPVILSNFGELLLPEFITAWAFPAGIARNTMHITSETKTPAKLLFFKIFVPLNYYSTNKNEICSPLRRAAGNTTA
jgi:hypothetical protein